MLSWSICGYPISRVLHLPSVPLLHPQPLSSNSAIEIEQMRQNSQVMQTINRISNAFGGDAKILLAIKDGQQPVMGMLLTVNPKKLVRMDFSQEIPTEVDATISLQYDFFYETMSTIIKDLEGSETIVPFWEQHKFDFPEVDDTLIIIGLFTKIIFAVPTGQVQVEPISAVPAVIFTLLDMIGLMQMG